MILYLLAALVIIILVLLAKEKKRKVTEGFVEESMIKGAVGESMVKGILKNLPGDYHALHNLILEKDQGSTQIDHVVVSKYGVFVVETKNYIGKIYGNDDKDEWTQIILNDVTYRRKQWKTYTYVTKK